MTNKRNNIAAGFTLIETLVAVLILSVAIVGPLTIASKGLNAALIAKDQTTAFYLAQDAVEYVRFKRDTYQLCLSQGLTTGNCAGATTWLGSGSNTLSLCTNVSGCYVDSLADSVKITGGNCSSSGILKYDPTAGHNFYTYSSGLPVTNCSIYNRTVKITNPLNGRSDEAQLTVSVTWKDIANTTHAVNVTENLFNWQQ